MLVEHNGSDLSAWGTLSPDLIIEDAVELKELGTSSTAILILPDKNDDKIQANEIFTKAYAINGFIVLLTTAVQSLANRLLNNNDIRAGDSANSSALMLDIAFANFSNKMVKGNWSEVDSVKKQSATLLAYVAQAIACDALASQIPVNYPQPLIIGQASVVAAITALGYATAMSSAAILGKQTYTKGKSLLKSKDITPNTNGRRAASGALVALTAMAAATANRLLVDPTSALGVVLNMACSEIVNKIFKTGQGTESETSNKVTLLGFYLLSALAADAAMGLAIPSALPITNPWRYFSATSIGASLSFVKVSAKALLDHDRVATAKSTNEGAPAEKKNPSKWRMLAAGISALAIPICTIAANHLSVVNQSPTISLGIKMIQHNANALAVGELFKLSTGTLQRTAISLAPAALSIGTELAANWLDPKNSGYSVTGVAVGIAASYLGMTLSGCLLGNTNADDV